MNDDTLVPAHLSSVNITQQASLSTNVAMTNPFRSEEQEFENFLQSLPSVIRLNIGGMYYTTRLSTLRKHGGSMLAAMFSGLHGLERDEEGRFFIDRDGTYFIHILNYLREETLPPPDDAHQVYEEAQYYGLSHLMESIENGLGMFGEKVRQAFVAQFGEYEEKLDKIVNSAKERALHSASKSRTSEVVFAVKLSRHGLTVQNLLTLTGAGGQKYEEGHACHTTDGQGKNYRTAEVVFGPWEAAASNVDVLTHCLLLDLTKRGLTVKPSGLQSLCRYHVGRGGKAMACGAQLVGIEFEWW